MQECDECPNVKLTQKTVELSFEIEKGMDTGYVITLGEAGEPHADGDSGDLNVYVVGLPDSLFRREGAHLKMNWEISLADALTGFSQDIKHLDGHKVCDALYLPSLCIYQASVSTKPLYLPSLVLAALTGTSACTSRCHPGR